VEIGFRRSTPLVRRVAGDACAAGRRYAAAARRRAEDGGDATRESHRSQRARAAPGQPHERCPRGEGARRRRPAELRRRLAPA
jgi:hypothetical protein